MRINPELMHAKSYHHTARHSGALHWQPTQQHSLSTAISLLGYPAQYFVLHITQQIQVVTIIR